MNKLIKILESIGIATITVLIACGFIGLLTLILLPFTSIFAVLALIIANLLGKWVCIGVLIGIVIVSFAIEVYKDM